MASLTIFIDLTEEMGINYVSFEQDAGNDVLMMPFKNALCQIRCLFWQLTPFTVV